MLICRRKKFCYICTPRTSSLSTSTWLMERFETEEICGYHGIPNAKNSYTDYLRFTTIRHPYTRAQSIFSWVMQQHYDAYPDLPKMEWIPFLRWLRDDAPGYKHSNKVMLVPQAQFLGATRVDHILRFEKIPKCYMNLPFITNLKRFPHINKGTRRKPELTEEAKRLIRDWAEVDFARWFKNDH